jgi:putative oxidoreductase
MRHARVGVSTTVPPAMYTGTTRRLKEVRMRRLSLRWLDRYRNLGLLIARGIPGVVFLYHGWQKLDRGVDGFAMFVRSLSIPLPDVVAYVVTYGELIGGALLIVGFLTRLTAVLFFVEMILTTAIVKVDVGLIAQDGAGAELDLVLLAAMAAVACFGPGSLSVDRNAGIEGRVQPMT